MTAFGSTHRLGPVVPRDSLREAADRDVTRSGRGHFVRVMATAPFAPMLTTTCCGAIGSVAVENDLGLKGRSSRWLPPPGWDNFMRSAFSLLELSIVILITAIGAAVVVPRWAQFQSETRLASASLALSSDVRSLQRYAARHSQPLQLTIQAETSVMTVSPPVSSIPGDASGRVDYSRRYPGVQFVNAPFDGQTTATINVRGELVSASTGQRLTAGTVTLGYENKQTDIDLLRSMNLNP